MYEKFQITDTESVIVRRKKMSTKEELVAQAKDLGRNLLTRTMATNNLTGKTVVVVMHLTVNGQVMASGSVSGDDFQLQIALLCERRRRPHEWRWTTRTR